MSDTIERFSNRVENYVKYRPDYPREIVGHLAEHCGLTSASIVADIGSGTGISARMFLENGNRVIGVEPNAAMRCAAEVLLGAMDFWAVDGTSAATTLADASVDMVTAAQAFHWFDPDLARAEFARIIKPGGYTVLIWNERQLDTTPFLKDYESFLVKYALDYGTVRHENIKAEELQYFFQKEYDSAVFSNIQIFDLEGLKGRMLSSSYMPNESHAIFGPMIDELKGLFAKHAENGKIKVFYDTRVYYFQI
jgi:SAM-dependent methyltransferase